MSRQRALVIFALLACIGTARAAAAALPVHESHARRADERVALRAAPNGTGPLLRAFAAEADALGRAIDADTSIHDKVTAGGAAPVHINGPSTDVFVDVPCNLFLPGRADPKDWMSTSTLVQVTSNGVNFDYGYDPFAQTYDMAVSGLADFSGILAQETVGVMAVQLPPEITAQNVRRIEAWFVVSQHNLYPYERVAITGLGEGIAPNSGLNSFEAQLLYEDARGYGGSLYFLDHLGTGPWSIDLGADAVADLQAQFDSGWFGVGFAADGWDLSGSLGQTIFWAVMGGGTMNPNAQPFFRIYYNAPPHPFDLVSPGDEVALVTDSPLFSWDEAIDPNGDTPMRYLLRLGTDVDLTSAFELDAGTSTSITVPFPLSPGIYYWQVIATDPGGESRASETRRLYLGSTTDVETPRAGFRSVAQPNPFNPTTTIHFSLPEAAPVSVEVFDPRGRRVRTLLQAASRPAGEHRIVWDGTDAAGHTLAAGTYIYRIRTIDLVETRKITLVE